MSTTKNFTIQKNTDNIIRCRARGYWDVRKLFNTNETDPTVDIEMKPYDGLNVIYQTSDSTPSSLNFRQTVLPFRWDYSQYLKNIKYVLMPKGQTYFDVKYLSDTYYTQMKGMTIDEGNQCTVVGKSSSWSYTKQIPSTAENVKMIFKMEVKTPSTSQNIVAVEHTSHSAQAFVQNSKLYKGYFDIATGGVTTLEDGKTYWFGVLEDASTIKGYLKEYVEEETIDTLPDFTDEAWTEEWTQPVSDKYTFKNADLQFFNSDASLPWLGNIDMNNCKIWVDGTQWWYYGIVDTIAEDSAFLGAFPEGYQDDGQEKTYNVFCKGDEEITLSTEENLDEQTYLGTYEIPAHDLYTYSQTSKELYDNFTIYDSDSASDLNVNNETGEVSGFSNSVYITLKDYFVPKPKTPWKIQMRFSLDTLSTGNYPIISCGIRQGIYLGVSNKHIQWGTDGDLVTGEAYELEEDVEYDVKIEFDGEDDYTTSYKRKDEDEWTEVGISNDPNSYVYGTDYLRIGNAGSYSFSGGKILLAGCFIEIDGQRWWNPTTTHYYGQWTKK